MSVKKNLNIGDFIFLGLNLLFFIGSIFLFNTCGPKDDGSWMTCHWAGKMVTILTLAMTVLSAILIFVPVLTKKGIYCACFVISIITILTPGTLIKLCMMETMRCRSISRPSVIVFSIIIAAYSIIKILIKSKQDKEIKA